MTDAPLPEKSELPVLPRPEINYADHSYPAFSKAQMEAYALEAIAAWNRRSAPPSSVDREGVARIILGPKSVWNYSSFGEDKLNDWAHNPDVARALAKADKILALLSRPSEGGPA